MRRLPSQEHSSFEGCPSVAPTARVTDGQSVSVIRVYSGLVALCLLASVGLGRWLTQGSGTDGSNGNNATPVILGNLSAPEAIDLGQRVYARLTLPGAPPAALLNWKAEPGEARDRKGAKLRFWTVSATGRGAAACPVEGLDSSSREVGAEMRLRFNADTAELIQCNRSVEEVRADERPEPSLPVSVAETAREYLCRLEASSRSDTSSWRLVSSVTRAGRISREVILQRGDRLVRFALCTRTGDLVSVRYSLSPPDERSHLLTTQVAFAFSIGTQAY